MMNRRCWPFVLVLALPFAACDTTDEPLEEEPVRPIDFRLQEITDPTGEPVQLSSTEGQVVFLNFFAPWCPNCQEEQPALNAVYERYKDRGFTILSVAMHGGRYNSTEQFLEAIREYRTTYNVEYPILIDNERVSQAYGVSGVPTTYLIARDPEVFGPYGVMTEEEMEGLIESEL